MAAENIYQNDDCNINIINVVDAALELTKLYYGNGSHSNYVSEDSIFRTYSYYKRKLLEEEDRRKAKSDCDTCENYGECAKENSWED